MHPALAELSIYEPFDYSDTAPTNDSSYLGDGNQAGGLGLGEWRRAISGDHEIEVIVPGLDFADEGGNQLPVSGGYAYRSSRVGQASVSSDVDPAATAALTADNSTMWMSFLYLDRGFSGPDSAIALASEDIVAADNQNLAAAGFGVGVDIVFNAGIGTAVYNGAANSAKVREAIPTFAASGGPENEVFMIAAKVNWKPDGELDEIFVFIINDLTTEPDESEAIASDTFDMLLVNQQTLDVLSIGETQIDGFDEIRLGNTFAEVVGGASAPASLELGISPSDSTPGSFDFSWTGREGKLYDLVSSTDLSTPPETWAVWDGQSEVASTTLTDVPAGSDPKRFFAIIEK